MPSSINLPIGQKETGGNFRAMIVDDSAFVINQLKRILQSEEFEIAETASDGEEALRKYKESDVKIDFVTLDITMPNVDGLAALEQIMKFDPEARVIMVSALGKEETVKKALLLGAKNYILKPFERTNVLEKIKKVIEK